MSNQAEQCRLLETCGSCGPFEVPIKDVTLSVYERPELSNYSSDCTTCEQTVIRPANTKAVARLIMAGAVIKPVTAQTVLVQTETAPPPITQQDVDRFAEWIAETPDPLADL